nr:hypothetical protein GTC16762_33920 [Pigmentibacter ruber]
MYLALLEFNCISGFGVPIGLSLLYVLWRSFIPKWLDIFKDYCEKLLDRWSLIDVYNTAQLKNEIFKLNKLIRKMYSENYKLRYEYLDIIDLKEIDNSEQKDHIVGFKDYETSRHIKLELFNNNKIKYFYFIVEKTENYVLIYKSIHNKITRFNIAGDINNRKRIETWEAGTSFTDYIDIKDGEYIWRGNK